MAVIESIALEPLQQADSEPLPTAHLKIMESLRPGVPQTVRFVPLLYGSDAYQSMSSDQRMHWKGMDLNSVSGKKWILITRGSSVIASYPFTAARVNDVKLHMAAGGFGGPLLLFLALMTVGLAVLNWLLSAALPPVGAFCILMLQLACFGIYEYGVPPGTSNRMDLLFLIPAILFNLWLTFRRRPFAARQSGPDRPD